MSRSTKKNRSSRKRVQQRRRSTRRYSKGGFWPWSRNSNSPSAPVTSPSAPTKSPEDIELETQLTQKILELTKLNYRLDAPLSTANGDLSDDFNKRRALEGEINALKRKLGLPVPKPKKHR